VPPWAARTDATCNGAALSAHPAGERLVVTRRWRSGDVIDLRFASGQRLVHWPEAGSPQVAVFDGPLCLALSSAVSDIDAFRYVRVGADGRLLCDDQGRPVALNAEGQVSAALAPMGDDWLSPDVREPNRLRLLFELTEARAPMASRLWGSEGASMGPLAPSSRRWACRFAAGGLPRRFLGADRTKTFVLKVFLADFEDVPHPERYSREYFNELMFGLGGPRVTPEGRPLSGSVREYFLNLSEGRIDIEGEVLDWVRIPRQITRVPHWKPGHDALR